MEIHINTILIHKKYNDIKLKVIAISKSERNFLVEKVFRGDRSTFNYDHIIRHYNIIPTITDILKKL